MTVLGHFLKIPQQQNLYIRVGMYRMRCILPPRIGRYAEEWQKLSKIAPNINFFLKMPVLCHFFQTFPTFNF